MSEEYEVRTGPVRVSGYSIKLRRVINGVLSDKFKKGELDSKSINDSISDLNKTIYQVIVDKFEVPKEAVTNIILKFSVGENKIKVKDINVEIFDRDEILSNNVTKELRNLITT